eukprot:gb/GECG01000192.1/.p1 GENE.gb/GECG01000192.1/~~gb/GECG01000192.1/.p1  ORF type:complete len:2067 (+),score=277.81 gb/GECG01000192.1/:1-6201(+)
MSSSSSASSSSAQPHSGETSSMAQQEPQRGSRPLSEYPEAQWEGMIAFVQEKEHEDPGDTRLCRGRVGNIHWREGGKVPLVLDSGDSIYRKPNEVYVWDEVSAEGGGNSSSIGPPDRKRRHSSTHSNVSEADEAGYNGDDSDGGDVDKGDQDLTGWPVSIREGEYQGCHGFVEGVVGDGQFEVSIINERVPTDSSFVIKRRDQLELSTSQAAFSGMLGKGTESASSSDSSAHREATASYPQITQALKTAVQLSGITKIDPLSVGHQLKLLDLSESNLSESRIPSVEEANDQWAEVSERERRIIIRHLNNCLPGSLRPVGLPPESKTSTAPKKTIKTSKSKKGSRSSRFKRTQDPSREENSPHTKSSQVHTSEEDTEEELDPEDMTIEDLGLEMEEYDTEEGAVDHESTFISAVLDVGAGATLQSTHRILDLLTLCTDWSTMLETSRAETGDREESSSMSTRRTTRRAKGRLRSTSTHTDDTAYDSENSTKKTGENKAHKEEENKSMDKPAEGLTIRQPDASVRRSARGGSTPGALSESMLARQKYSPKEDQDSKSNPQREGEKATEKTTSRSQGESDAVSAKRDRDIKGKSSSKTTHAAQQTSARGKAKLGKEAPKNAAGNAERETSFIEQPVHPSFMAATVDQPADVASEDDIASSITSHPPYGNTYFAYDNTLNGLNSGLTFQSGSSVALDATSSIRRRLREERKIHWSHNEDYTSDVIEWAQQHGGAGLPLSVIPFYPGNRSHVSQEGAFERIKDSRYLLLHPELVARSMQGLSSVSGGGTSIRRVADQYGCQGGDSLYDLASQLGIASQLNLQSFSAVEAEHRKGRMSTSISSAVVEDREAGVEENNADGEDEELDGYRGPEEDSEQPDGRRKPRIGAGGKRTQERFAFYNVYCEWAKSKNIVPLAFRNWYYALDVKDRLRYQVNRLRERQDWDRRAYIHEFTSNLDLSFPDRYSEALIARALQRLGTRVHQEFGDTLNLDEVFNLENLEQVAPGIAADTRSKIESIEPGKPILYFQIGENQLKKLEEQCLFGHREQERPKRGDNELPDLDDVPWYMFQRYLFRRNLLCSTVAPTNCFRQKGDFTKNGRETSEAAISSPYLGTETDSDSDDDVAQRNSASIGLNSLRHHNVERKRQQPVVPEPQTMDQLFCGHAVDIDNSLTCHACGREKESLAENCWNPNCYLCPIYGFKAECRRRRTMSQSADAPTVRDPSALCSPRLASWVRGVLEGCGSLTQRTPRLYYNLIRGFSKNNPHLGDECSVGRAPQRGKRYRCSASETDSSITSVAPKWQKGAIRSHFMPLSEEIEADTKLRELYGEEYAFAYAHSFGMPRHKSTLADANSGEERVMSYARDFTARRRKVGGLAKAREYLRCTRNAIGQPVSKASEEQAGTQSNAILNRYKRFSRKQGVAMTETSVVGGLGDNTSATALARQKAGKTLLRDGNSSGREFFSELWEENERLRDCGTITSEDVRGSYRDTCRFGPVKTADDICTGGFTCPSNPRLEIEAQIAQYFHSTAEALSRLISSDGMKEFFHTRSNLMKILTEDYIDQDPHQVVWDRLFNKGALNQNPTPVLANLNLENPAPQNPRNCSVGDRTALGEMITSALQVQFSDGNPTSTTAILLSFDCKIYRGVFTALNRDFFSCLENACISHIKEATQAEEMSDTQYLAAAVVQRFSNSIRDHLLVNANQNTINAMYSDIADFMDENNRAQPELTVPKQLQKWGEEIGKHVNHQIEPALIDSVSNAIHCLTQGLGALFLLISYLTQMISKRNAAKAFIGSTASRKNTVQISDLISEISADAKTTIISRIINGLRGSRYLQSRTLEVLKESVKQGAIVFQPLLSCQSANASQSANNRFNAAVAHAQDSADTMLPQRSEPSGVKQEQEAQSTIFEEQPDDEDWSFYTYSAPVRVVGLKRGREDLYWDNREASSPNSLDLAMLYDSAYNHRKVSMEAKRARLLHPHGGLPNFPTKGILPPTVTAPFSLCNADSANSHRYRYNALAPDETDHEVASAWKRLVDFRRSAIEPQELMQLRPSVARLRSGDNLQILSETAMFEASKAT